MRKHKTDIFLQWTEAKITLLPSWWFLFIRANQKYKWKHYFCQTFDV